MGRSVHIDFFFTPQAFFLFHLWFAWIAVKLFRFGAPVGRGTMALGYLAFLTIVAVHARGVWLSSHGVSVGPW